MASMHMTKGNASNGSVNAAKALNRRAKEAVDELQDEMITIRRAKRKPLPKHMQTPEMRFKRLAGIRAKRIAMLLDALCKCLNPDVYTSTQADRKRVHEVIKNAYITYKDRWAPTLNEDIHKEAKANGTKQAKLIGIFGV
jgi:hypothetical protein